MIPLAVETWSHLLTQRDALFFVDNDPAKDALVNGISRSHISSEIVRACRIRCAALGLAPWFDRVPSPSNIADGPSTGEVELLTRAGAVRVAPSDLPELQIWCEKNNFRAEFRS